MSKFLKGSVSCTLLRTDKKIESITEAREAIAEYSFKPLIPEAPNDESIGWVDPILSFDSEWFTNMLAGENMLLAMRADKYSFSASQMRPYIEKKEFEHKKDSGKDYIPAQTKKEIKEQVTKMFRSNSYPKVTITEAFWNTTTGEVYIMSQSSAVIAKFKQLFEFTFAAVLEPVEIIDRADETAFGPKEPLFSKIWGE